MNTTKLILIGCYILLAIYATIFEYNEYNHSYELGKPDDEDTLLRSLHKVGVCNKYEARIVKWRRIFICSGLIIFFLFAFVHRRFPSTKEVLLHAVIIFLILTLNASDYTTRITKEVNQYNEANVNNIKRRLSETRSFIFPWG